MSVDLAELLVTADHDAVLSRQSTYQCAGCNEQIPAHKARVHCQICEEFDLCANCFVVGVKAGSHAPHHPTSVIAKSGLIAVAASDPPSPPETPPEEPKDVILVVQDTVSEPQVQKEQTSSSSVTPPNSNPDSMNAPIRSRPPSISVQRRAVGSKPTPPAPPPRLPPRPTPPTAASSSANNSAWQPLFDGNLASPIFIALLNDIFSLLDPRKSGHLTPEAYSSFLDTQGYALEHNIWKKSLNPVYGQYKESVADAAFKEALDNFSIEHSMAPRQRAPVPPNNMFGRMSLYESVHQQITQATARQLSSGQMPLLTRKGFIDVTTLEVLADPSKGWGNLNRALRAYRLWQEKGPIPREMIPAFPPREIIDHAKRVGEMAQQKAQVKLANQRVYSNLVRDGLDHAVDLTRPDRDRYYYY